MDAQIKITKRDNGTYGDSFHLTITALNGDSADVRISGMAYDYIKTRFPFLTKEEQQFPSDVREVCY